MTDLNTNPLLKTMIALDVTASVAAALLLLFGANLLAGPLGISSAFLFYIGVVLVPWVALLGWILVKRSVPNFVIWLVIAVNALWVADSIILMLGNWLQPTTFGYAFIIAQTVIVAGFAEFQFVGMRKSRAITA